VLGLVAFTMSPSTSCRGYERERVGDAKRRDQSLGPRAVPVAGVPAGSLLSDALDGD
jgi:hypothetical protein